MPVTAIRDMTEQGRKAPLPLSERAEAGLKLLDSQIEQENAQAAQEAEAQKVDFADLTADTITVNDITIPIPSALADDIIRNHLQSKIEEQLKSKEIGSPSELSKAAWRWIATQWWILDHQYDKVDGKYVIKQFMTDPGHRPPDDELADYLGQLDHGPRLNDFYSAYRTATAFDNAEDRRKKVEVARQTGQTQKIPVLLPFISPSEKPK